MIEQVGTEQTKDEMYIRVLVERARKAMEAIEGYDQKRVDRLCQAIGWATAKEACFVYLTRLGVNESGMGDYETRCGKRFKIYGVLRDILREKSVGIIEEIPEKGIVKYARPAGVLAGVVPCTNPVLTPAVTALFTLKCKDAVIFSPHPRTKKTTLETVRIKRHQ
jgi:sulfoacetaldehyde dehydrogenase